MVERWVLLRGQTRLGVLRVVDVDQPWFEYTFEPTAAFEQVRELFDEERRLLEVGDMGAWSSAWERIAAQQLALEPLDDGAPDKGTPITTMMTTYTGKLRDDGRSRYCRPEHHPAVTGLLRRQGIVIA